MRDVKNLAKQMKTFEQFIAKLVAFGHWYTRTDEQMRWGKAQWYEFYNGVKGA